MRSRQVNRTLFLILAGTALTGCDEEPLSLTACQKAGQQPASLQLSSGYDAFEVVEDGGYLPAYFGSQGGAHAYVGVRVTGVNPGNVLDPLSAPVVQWDAWDGDDLVGSGFTHEQLEEKDGSYELHGAMMFVDSEYAWTSADEEIPAETVDVVVSIEDSCGTLLEERLQVYLGNRYQPEE